jgi:dipeptidyl aminopeptidase/acylaminoacyl peptidase
VVRGGYYGRFVASPNRSEREGHLIYMQQGTVFAVPFDLDRLETVGQAVPAIEGVEASLTNTGGVQMAFASDGTLVFVPGTAGATAGNAIDWLTRDGKTSILRATPSNWLNPRFSPDGQKLALEISDGKQRDIWVYDWARDTIRQLTFDAGDDREPVWTPNSRRIVFSSDRAKPGTRNLYWTNADGTGEVTRLTDSPDIQQPYSWTPDQKVLAFQQTARERALT